MADSNLAKETIFDDSFRRGLPADQVPALFASLGYSDVHAADVKPCEGGLSNTVFVAGKYIIKVNTFSRFPFMVHIKLIIKFLENRPNHMN